MPEPTVVDAEDAESTDPKDHAAFSKDRISWLLTDRVDYVEEVCTHLLEQNKSMLKYLAELAEAVAEISEESSEE